MIFRALDSDGDWIFGSGKSSYARFNDAIILNIETSLKTFATECFFNPDVGQPWFDIINNRNKDVVVLFIKNAIAQLYGVIGINEVSYNYGLDRVLEIKYNISTQYEKNLQGTVII